MDCSKAHPSACFLKAQYNGKEFVEDELLHRFTGEFSEFLFASHFWNKINETCGTNFDQYEEDEAEGETLSAIAIEVEAIKQTLPRDIGDVRFTRAWNENGDPIEITLKRTQIIGELDILKIAVMRATADQHILIFHL